MGFTMDARSMIRNLDAAEEKYRYAVFLYAKSAAADMQKYAKQNGPWTDRTGTARRGIRGSAEQREGGRRTRIYLRGGVNYAVYLEYAHKKKYAVLWPTIQKKAPDVMRNLPKLDRR